MSIWAPSDIKRRDLVVPYTSVLRMEILVPPLPRPSDIVCIAVHHPRDRYHHNLVKSSGGVFFSRSSHSANVVSPTPAGFTNFGRQLSSVWTLVFQCQWIEQREQPGRQHSKRITLGWTDFPAGMGENDIELPPSLIPSPSKIEAEMSISHAPAWH